MDIYPVQDIIFYTAFVILWAMGFASGVAR
jgi:hypothetical protein